MAFKTLYAAEDFDDLDEFFDCGSVDFFVVWRRFAKLQDSESSKKNNQKQWWWFLQYQDVSWCTVWTMKSSKLQDFSKAPMVLFPAPGCFPVYRLTSESNKENQSREVMVIFPVLGFSRCTVWQWVKQGKLIKSPFSLYISRYVNVRKQKNRYGVSWLCHYSTPTNGTSWETIQSENNNGLILYCLLYTSDAADE